MKPRDLDLKILFDLRLEIQNWNWKKKSLYPYNKRKELKEKGQAPKAIQTYDLQNRAKVNHVSLHQSTLMLVLSALSSLLMLIRILDTDTDSYWYQWLNEDDSLVLCRDTETDHDTNTEAYHNTDTYPDTNTDTDTFWHIHATYLDILILKRILRWYWYLGWYL